ncbi:MAG: L-histidine N(alpha)-methyltransferase [Gemmatimonadetes bacterium]|nr:L-histidine N(alpha)-methyltransferase [Gemmatimonadota bacterium]NIO32907.1 L-histidine N(alpha)-methyltransferase [Gemmatimonadota bacterium]
MSDFPTRFRQAVGAGAVLVEAPGTGESLQAFARSVAAGLSDDPKWLHYRFLYDAEGSRLFEEITRQPEYYPTRTEAGILADYADEIQRFTGPLTLVELGSGYSVKTEYLLSAYSRDGEPLRYVPVDVSGSALLAASRSIAESFSDVDFTGINGTYRSAFPVLRQLSPQMLVFLGSSIGNFNEAETTSFWRSVTDHLPAGDFFLLGVDLVKDVDVMEAAYNDAAGVTARFTNNYFGRINRELGAALDLSQIEHNAIWNPALERIEIYARFNSDQQLYVEPLDQVFEIRSGERIMIEISRKHRLPKLQRELTSFGFELKRVFTDEKKWFALLLLERTDDTLIHAAYPPATR